jgi:excinuclease UvrABC nuclease subunit
MLMNLLQCIQTVLSYICFEIVDVNPVIIRRRSPHVRDGGVRWRGIMLEDVQSIGELVRRRLAVPLEKPDLSISDGGIAESHDEEQQC